MLSEEHLDAVVDAIVGLVVGDWAWEEVDRERAKATVRWILCEGKHILAAARMGLITEWEAATALIANLLTRFATPEQAVKVTDPVPDASLRQIARAMLHFDADPQAGQSLDIYWGRPPPME